VREDAEESWKNDRCGSNVGRDVHYSADHHSAKNDSSLVALSKRGSICRIMDGRMIAAGQKLSSFGYFWSGRLVQCLWENVGRDVHYSAEHYSAKNDSSLVALSKRGSICRIMDGRMIAAGQNLSSFDHPPDSLDGAKKHREKKLRKKRTSSECARTQRRVGRMIAAGQTWDEIFIILPIIILRKMILVWLR